MTAIYARSEETRKRCSKCSQTKEVTAFTRNRAAKDGLHNQCKTCANSYVRKKECWRCRKKQTRKAFFAHRRRADGITRLCRVCFGQIGVGNQTPVKQIEETTA